MRPDHEREGFGGILLQRRVRAIHEDHPPGADLLGRTECRGITQIFCSTVYPTALRPVEWQLFPIHGKKVLAEELSEMLEKVPKAADQGEISANGMGFLEEPVLYPQG